MKLKKLTEEKMDMDQQEFRTTLKELAMMGTAEIFAQLSTCSRLKVGSVISNKDFSNIYSIGINGGIIGQFNDCLSLEPGKCGHYHAELNAIIKPQFPNKEKYLFITHFPCSNCAGLIVNTKSIIKVYYRNNYNDDDITRNIFEKANIELIKI